MLTLELPPDLQSRLEALAARTGRQPADLVVEAIAQQLGGLEDRAIAEAGRRDLQEGKSETTPLEDAIRLDDLANFIR